jgi:hypothetical protein
MLRPAMETPAQKAHQENPMNSPHYIGFDVRKKTISFCVKTAGGEIAEEGSVAAHRAGLRQWAEARPHPWRGAMEATLFSGWIYDTLFCWILLWFLWRKKIFIKVSNCRGRAGHSPGVTASK